MEMQELPDEVKVTGKNKDGGISVAHLFSSAKTEQAIVDTFFCAPTNWKNVTNALGKAVKYPNHWHFRLLPFHVKLPVSSPLWIHMEITVRI